MAMAALLIPGGAPADQRDDRIDVERFRRAAAAAVERVGEPPAEAASYFADHPYSLAHPSGEPIGLTQPDGTQFAARQREWSEGGGMETEDGHLVTRGADGVWRYARWSEAPGVVATGAVVGRDPAPKESRASNTTTAVKGALDRDARMREEMRRYTAARARAVADAAEAVGEPFVMRIPVLLFKINNQDFRPGTTADYVESLIDGVGTNPNGTLAELYAEQSHGKLRLEFDVFGPYDISVSNNSENDCWYGTVGGPVLGDFLGLGGGGAKGMAAEVVPQADPEVDFSRYDNDGDGYVDFTAIMHSGGAYEVTGDWCDVWSHYWSGFGPGAGLPPDPTPTTDGVIVGSVLTVPEIEPFTGVFGHEIMHALGEPDYYATEGPIGTGDWDLGGTGSYLGQPTQSNPSHLNPLVKINLGWVEPTIVDATTYDLQVRPRSTHPDVALIPFVTEPAGPRADQLCGADPIGGFPGQNRRFKRPDGSCIVEGLLVEQISQSAGVYQPTGGGDCRFVPAHFDRQVYASGLAVWHFDFRSYRQLGNNNWDRPMLSLVEFDLRDDGQDLRDGISRGEPSDLFRDDPVGISSATAGRVSGAPPPAGSPYTVVAPLPQSEDATPAWTVPPEVPPGTDMLVTLSWATENSDDWDLFLEQHFDGFGFERVNDAGSAAGTGPEVLSHPVSPGETFRAIGKNWLSTTATATISVAYGGLPGATTASTLTNDGQSTGWQITNIRPFGSRGTAHAGQRPGSPITFDVVRHDSTTVDASPDFLRTRDGAVPILGGKPIALSTRLYNHGGKAVNGVTISVFDVDPATPGATPLSTQTKNLTGFDRQDIVFTVTPPVGTRTYYVRTVAAGDRHPANDVVATEISADPVPANVLIVDDDRGFTFEEPVEAVLQGFGVPYHVVRGAPTLATLQAYPAVVWLTTSVAGGSGALTYDAAEAIWDYLNAGGRMWMQSSRAMSSWVIPEFFGLYWTWAITDSPGSALPEAATALPALDLGVLDGRGTLLYGQRAWWNNNEQPLFRHSSGANRLIAARSKGSSSTAYRTVYSFPLAMMTDAAQRAQFAQEALAHLGVARRQVTRPPTVRFERFMHVAPGKDKHVSVGASGAGLTGVELWYRPHGQSSWTVLPLAPAGAGLYGGTIPGSGIGSNGIDYFARAMAGSTPIAVSAGGEAMPNVASGSYGAPAPGTTACPA